jgi:hypothetical protein
MCGASTFVTSGPGPDTGRIHIPAKRSLDGDSPADASCWCPDQGQPVEEELELKELHCQLDARFGEVVALIAQELGCSEGKAHEEAKQATEEWDIAANEIRAPGNNHLTHLLAKHFEIKERILNIRDDVMVRWDGDDYRESGI